MIPLADIEAARDAIRGKVLRTPLVRLNYPEAGKEIYSWTAMPGRTLLGPGETLPFRSRLASPPGESRDVSVRFFTRRDALAGER